MEQLWTPWRMTYLKGETTPTDTCVFCRKIEADDETEHMIFRSKYVFVTLNLFPYNNGHLLIVPYRHVGDLAALSVEEMSDLMCVAQDAVGALRSIYNPHGFNMGINLGAAAGAGIAEHIHMHVVPRWAGDTNYMTVVGQTRVIPEMLADSYRRLREVWPVHK